MKATVKMLVATALSSREHANNLVEIISLINPKRQNAKLLEVVNGAVKVLTQYIKEDIINGSVSSESDKVYVAWLLDQHTECFDEVISCLKLSTEHGLDLLENLLSLLQLKACYLNRSSDKLMFPEDLLEKIVEVCLSSTNPELLEHIVKLLALDDFRYFVLKATPKIINSRKFSVEKLYDFLKTFVCFMPNNEGVPKTSFVFPDDDKQIEKFTKCPAFVLSHHQKKFSSAWLEFLKSPLPGSIHKNILICLHTNLLPNFAKPRLLADFLIRSYNKGGGLALLALHGLFVLINQHNLEYPEFFKNVYAMLHPRIFDARYKARFFYLLDLFLSSTHIPSYLVAAFVKKMARLCLISPPDGICIMVPLILNLLRRHPSIRKLIHCQNADDTEMCVDPFIETALDPKDSCALESSLWELKTLKSHYSPEVVQIVSFKAIGSMETDIGERLELDYTKLFDKSCQTDFKDCPVTFTVPKTLFGNFEDATEELWEV